MLGTCVAGRMETGEKKFMTVQCRCRLVVNVVRSFDRTGPCRNRRRRLVTKNKRCIEGFASEFQKKKKSFPAKAHFFDGFYENSSAYDGNGSTHSGSGRRKR